MSMHFLKVLAPCVAASLCLVCSCSNNAVGDPDYHGKWGKVESSRFDKAQGVSETVLANGLKILVKESHSAPVVYFGVWYRVGSRNDPPGESGMAHVVEHMTFEGTKTLPPTAFDRLVRGNGAEANASTTVDRTEYHEVIASDRLELAVKVEADRMANATFGPAELRREIKVIESEMEGRNNDVVDNIDLQRLRPIAFVKHPYGRPVIGSRNDVLRLADRRADVAAFYAQHYAPNKAVVVIVGDCNVNAAVALCQKYFGGLPPSKIARSPIPREPDQTAERRTQIEEPCATTELAIGYHTPAATDKDCVVLDALASLLADGRNSRLRSALYSANLASGVSAYRTTAADPGLFVISVRSTVGASSLMIEDTAYAEIYKLQSTTVPESELREAISRVRSAFYGNHVGMRAAGQQIGRAEILEESAGGYRYLDHYVERLEAVTPDDIKRVCQKYLMPHNRSVAVVVPGTARRIESSTLLTDAFSAEASQPSKPAVLRGVSEKAAVDNAVKNYVIHPVTNARQWHEKPTRVVLPNGVVVIVMENHATQHVGVRGRIRAGGMHAQSIRFLADVASLTSGMLKLGTTTRSAEELARQSDAAYCNIQYSSDAEETTIFGSSGPQDFTKLMGLIADEVQHSSFPTDEFDRLKERRAGTVERTRLDAGSTSDAGDVAETAMRQAIYPATHPYWSPSVDQKQANLRAVTVDDVKKFYATFYRPDTLVLAVVGDVKTSEVIGTIRSLLGGWKKPNAPPSHVIPPTVSLPPSKPAVRYIGVPGAQQSSILWGHRGTRCYADKASFASDVLHCILGGSASGSRLGWAIRSSRGLAYSVDSSYCGGLSPGPVEIFVGTDPRNTTQVIGLIDEVVRTLCDKGVTQDEVDEAKRQLTGSFTRRLDKDSAVAEQLIYGEDYNVGLDYLDRYADYINAVTVAQVNAEARATLAPDRATVIVCGPPLK